MNFWKAILFSFIPVAYNANSAQAGYTFASLGNFGYPTNAQSQVAETLKEYARNERLSMILSPGSNFVGGVSSVKDEDFQHLFEDVYSSPDGVLKVPFFTVLGVEDWAGDYNAEIARTDLASNDESAAATYPQWSIPNWFYHYIVHFQTSQGTNILGAGHNDLSVGFIFIDTWVLSSQFPVAEVKAKAWNDLRKVLELAPAVLDYIIVVGDKPIYSSGASKGDAYLAYYLLPLLVKADVDAYIAGYDFDMEVIETDGITQINCGNGAASAGQYASVEGSLFYSGETGFCMHTLSASGFETKFVNGSTGNVEYTHTSPIKSRPERATVHTMNYLSQFPKVEFIPVPEMSVLPTHEAFIRTVGTIGIVLEVLFGGLATAVLVSRMLKTVS